MTWDLILVFVLTIAAGYVLALGTDHVYEKIRERLRR